MDKASIEGFNIASEEDLINKKGIIYAIVNNYDGKAYVGKTKTSFRKRYGPTWWKTTANVLLKRTLKHNAPDNFKLYILEFGIKGDKALCARERHYANILNSYCPNGYNIRECGEGQKFFGKEVNAKMRLSFRKRWKTYKIKKIDTQEVIEIKGIRKWCEKNKIREMALRNLLCGIVIESQGYCLPHLSKEDIDKKRYSVNAKEYVVKKIQTGGIIKFENVRVFTEQNGLDEMAFRCMLCGAHKTSQGYCLPATKVIIKTFYYKAPDGKIHGVLEKQRPTFARNNGLHRDDLSRLSCGRCKIIKGWTFIRSESRAS